MVEVVLLQARLLDVVVPVALLMYELIIQLTIRLFVLMVGKEAIVVTIESRAEEAAVPVVPVVVELHMVPATQEVTEEQMAHQVEMAEATQDLEVQEVPVKVLPQESLESQLEYYTAVAVARLRVVREEMKLLQMRLVEAIEHPFRIVEAAEAVALRTAQA